MSDRSQWTRERWLKVEHICARALDLPADERASLLRHACADDPRLRHEVESLLASESDIVNFLEGSADDVAADLLEPASSDFAGRRIGSYVIGECIGAGGMGDVYRAHDEQLGRDVALKVLPTVFADQEDRVARFMAEARTLAALNHPNIATIHGLQEAAAVRALVLELVDGPTLADLIDRGPLQVEDALPIARQIAEGLEAAHECGIVHRDLKPSNVIVRSDGTIKLLDFGLATAVRESTPGDDTRDPVMGTPAYASPEQVRGRPTDRRTDIWAFGVLLYEMLSGRRVFAGDTTSEIVTAVLRQSIDWSALPASTPAAVRRLLARCLDRDARMRLRDIGEARIALEQLWDAGESELDPLPAAAPTAARARRGWQSWIVALAAGAVAIVAGAVFLVSSREVPAAPVVTRFSHTLPSGQSIALPAGGHVLAVSSDGQQIVYVVDGGLQLRSMSSVETRMIRGSETQGSITTPVFSPKGEAIAFWSHLDRAIKRLPVAGGEAVSIATVDEPYGMSWDGDTILIGEGSKGIMRVRADGGTPETIVRVKEDEEAHGPHLLPDGDHLLFTLASGTSPDRWDRASIVVQSISSGQRTVVISGGTDARYVATGHLVYGRSDTTFGSATLFAACFDVARMVVGSGLPMIEGVRTASSRRTGALEFALSDHGTLAYVPGSRVGPEFGPQQLVIADRTGKVEPLPVAPDSYRAVRVSPDGLHIAVELDAGKDANIFVSGLNGAAPIRRLTFDGRNTDPVWSTDRHIAFQSNREGDRAIFTQAADGTDPARRLTRPGPNESHAPESWSPDGRTLLFSIATSSYTSLATLSMNDGRVTAFGSAHSVIPMNARFSPDGRWIAYSQGDRGGGVTIHVEPFPATGANHQLVVTGPNSAAHKPVWSPDGRELFYVPRLGGFEVVRVTTQPAFAYGLPVPVPRKFNPGAPSVRALFDVAPDGRFVGIVPVGDQAAIYAAPQIQVVLNWVEELKRLVPASGGWGSADLPSASR